jgi:hypothetical protein
LHLGPLGRGRKGQSRPVAPLAEERLSVREYARTSTTTLTTLRSSH